MKEKLEDTISEKSIERMVRTFYPMVLKDDLVGPFFEKSPPTWYPPKV